jgi:glycosyltransferase involved in cell wall biosynthesis
VAKGEIVITMDADLQNDPADIPTLLEALTPEVDCVCGIRRTREDDFVKRISSRIANGFRNWITGDNIQDAGCTYRALRRNILGEMVVFNGMHRFIPTILRAQGCRVVEIKVNHRPRTKGVSKYGVGNRLWRGILDCLAIRWYRRRALAYGRSWVAGGEGTN